MNCYDAAIRFGSDSSTYVVTGRVADCSQVTDRLLASRATLVHTYNMQSRTIRMRVISPSQLSGYQQSDPKHLKRRFPQVALPRIYPCLYMLSEVSVLILNNNLFGIGSIRIGPPYEIVV